MDNNSLAHTKWECKYHLVFAPKYRRQVIYKDIKADVGQILGTLCRRKGIEIIEVECCSDHIHFMGSGAINAFQIFWGLPQRRLLTRFAKSNDFIPQVQWVLYCK